MKNISILGSAGSVGTQALDVIRATGCAKVVGLSTGGNINALAAQVSEFLPEAVSVFDGAAAKELGDLLKKNNIKTEIFYGQSGNETIASLESADLILDAISGFAGLAPTIKALEAGKNVATTNKESLVAAGEIVMRAAKENGAAIIPVDSEHSAIFQCLHGNPDNPYEKIYLTASGGPFRGKTRGELLNVTPEEALAHPTWKMGKKITVDSATLMNKGLEFIEAKWLFGAELDQIEIILHPQSVVHSMVQFEDGAVIAQLGAPDMRVPIQYALTYPRRVKNNFARADFTQIRALTFEKPDFVNFPCLELAVAAIREGGCVPAVMSAADEIAVARFLNGEIGFYGIPALIDRAVSAYISSNTSGGPYGLGDIAVADAFARDFSVRYNP